MGNTHVEYMRSFVVILSLLWLQTQSSLFNALAASPNHNTKLQILVLHESTLAWNIVGQKYQKLIYYMMLKCASFLPSYIHYIGAAPCHMHSCFPASLPTSSLVCLVPTPLWCSLHSASLNRLHLKSLTSLHSPFLVLFSCSFIIRCDRQLLNYM